VVDEDLGLRGIVQHHGDMSALKFVVGFEERFGDKSTLQLESFFFEEGHIDLIVLTLCLVPHGIVLGLHYLLLGFSICIHGSDLIEIYA
jgi:hypothetical protein